MTVVFDGKKFAGEKEKLISKRISQYGFTPKIVSIFFREDSGSLLYTNLKQKAAKRVGIHFHPEEISVKTKLEDIIGILKKYSQDHAVQGLMVQKPAQEVVAEVGQVGIFGFDAWWRKIVEEIIPEKDVDCLHPVNLELVYLGKGKILPATVKAVMDILNFSLKSKNIRKKKVAVIGKSEMVGRPLAYILAQKGASVSLCGSEGLAAKSIANQLSFAIKPQDLKEVLVANEIVVSATGRAGLIKGDMIKDKVIIIDVGSPIGDVDFASVVMKASFITPVPGGVGPVTVVSLLENLLDILNEAYS